MNNTTLSKIVASALPAICLSTQITSDCHAGELLRSIQYEQSKLPQVTQNQVMQNVFKNYDNLNEEVKDTLDTLWRNDAGNLLLRRLYESIKNDTQRLTILWNAHHKSGKTNLFCYDNLSIYLDKSKFCKYVGYCNEELIELPETLDAVLFHELCHGLHYLTGTQKTEETIGIKKIYNIHAMDCIDIDILDAWEDDEELYTITGWYVAPDGKVMFDCLNTNSYLIFKALQNRVPAEKVVQRVYHCDYASLEVYEYAKDMGFRRTLIRAKKYIDT